MMSEKFPVQKCKWCGNEGSIIIHDGNCPIILRDKLNALTARVETLEARLDGPEIRKVTTIGGDAPRKTLHDIIGPGVGYDDAPKFMEAMETKNTLSSRERARKVLEWLMVELDPNRSVEGVGPGTYHYMGSLDRILDALAGEGVIPSE